jgi:hypothetical protein
MNNNRAITSDPTQASRTAALCDKAEGYPRRGTSAANGLPVGPVGFVDGAYGWSTFRAAVSGSTFRAANGESWILANGTPVTLTPEERTELASLLLPGRRASSRTSVRAW